MNEKPQDDFAFVDDRFGRPVNVRVKFGAYTHGGTAIQLVTADADEDGPAGMPWATASVNAPQAHITSNEVILKEWSENEGLGRLLVKVGVVEEQPRGTVDLGHVQAQIYGLTPRALELSQSKLPRHSPRP